MPTSPQFPAKLLNQTPQERCLHFENKLIAHPILKDTLDQTSRWIHCPAGASIIMVFGPTGVGKSTLSHRMAKQLLVEAAEKMASDPAHIPVAEVEAVSPENGIFNWRDYYIRLLLALNEPLADKKVDLADYELRLSPGGQPVVPRHSQAPELRRALERCLQHRRPLALLTDEGQHLRKMASGRRALDQLDALKSLASTGKTLTVLLGTYDLLDLGELNGQLVRRIKRIHFPRYHPDGGPEAKAFQSILLTFQGHLPVRHAPDLVGWHDFMYEGSLGCVGILKNWLNRALETALASGAERITRQLLEQCAEPTATLVTIAEEIHRGEERLQLEENRRPMLRSLLGMLPTDARRDDTKSSPPPPAPSPKRRGRVGKRSPKRDPIGRACASR